MDAKPTYILPRVPQWAKDWLSPGENIFNLNQEQLYWFALFVKEASK